MNKRKMRLEYYGIIQDVVGKRTDEVLLLNEETVRDLLTSLARRYGEAFSYNVIAADGTLRSNVTILLDGVNINQVDGLDTKLEGYSEGKLAVMNVIGGGQVLHVQ